MIFLPTLLNNDKIKSTVRLKMLASYFLEEYIMKKIAILRCLKTSASCAGAGCLRALYEKDKAFAQYGDEELRLMAMWTLSLIHI